MFSTKCAIKNHGISCFPTETVYALGCLAISAEAIEKIYKIKQRKQASQCSIMIYNIKQVSNFIKINKKHTKIIDYCFPGPFTLIVELLPNHPFPKKFFSSSIGIRIPNHPFAINLLQQINAPIIATSTNISGKKPAKKHKEISIEILDNVNFVFKDDRGVSGVESTVIDLQKDTPVVTRQKKLNN